jgi:hypothetical protein
MPDQMPEKDAAFIQAECLKAARRALGCSDLQAVRIGPLKPKGSGPNWEVYGFFPTLPAMLDAEARKAIAPIRQTYALKLRGKF